MTNIALVVLDTLRKDYFDKHFDWMPGTDLENGWSTSHWTVAAHASLFTGKYPSEVGCTKKSEALTDGVSYLPEEASDAGYTTRGFSSNVYLSHHFGYDRGFDEFGENWRIKQIPDTSVFDWQEFIGRTQGMGPKRFPLALWECLRSDKPLVPSLRHGVQLKANDLFDLHEDAGGRSTLEYVEETDFGDEEFLFVNLMEAHTPYDPPEEYRTVEWNGLAGIDATLGDGPADGEGHIKKAYDGAVRYLSDIYRRIFEEIEDDFDVVITTGDHGELLGEYEAWSHWYGISPELTHVPMNVYGIDVEADRLTSILDIHETVSSLSGLSLDSRGVDLRHERDQPFLTEYHGVSEQHIRVSDAKGFDLTPYDRELRGVVDEDGYAYEDFDGFVGDEAKRELIEDLSEDVERYYGADESGGIDDALQSHLEDLGYA